MNDLIEAYDEYIALLADSEMGMLGLAHAHGYRTPRESVKRGEELRARIFELKQAALRGTAQGSQVPVTGTIHKLKTWPEYFNEVLSGRKPFEWRVDDRDFKLGDTLVLQEYIPHPENPGREGKYTGREITKTVSYLFSPWATNKRTVVMGLAVPSTRQNTPPTKAWSPDQFWEFAEGLTDAFVRDQMRDTMAERGLAVTSTDKSGAA